VAAIYERHIKGLSVEEQIELLATIAGRLAGTSDAARTEPKHSILELHGLGKDIWQGIDAKEYVERLRDEWEKPA
jgi:hypothetical protein